MTHTPGRRALLARAAYAPDCTPEERDRILRVYFPNLNAEHAYQQLRAARDAHHQRRGYDAEQIIAQLAGETT